MSESFLSRISRLLRTAQPSRGAAPLIISLGLLAALLEGFGLYLFIPLLQSMGVAVGARGGIPNWVTQLAVALPESVRLLAIAGVLFGCIVLKNVVGHINHRVTRQVHGNVAHRLRLRVFRQTVDSCIDHRVECRRTDIVDTLATNTWTVASALALFHYLLICGCTLVVFAALLLSISPRLTAVAAVFLGIVAVLVRFATRRAQALGQQVVAQNKRFGLRMWESIVGLRLIRSFSREQHEMERFEHASEQVRQQMLKMDLLWSVISPISEVSAALLIALLIFTGNGLGVGVPALAAFLALLYRMQSPVHGALSCLIALEGQFAAVDDVAEYLERTRQPLLRNGSQPFVRMQDGIEFRDVTFCYDASEGPALDRVSFRIPRGMTVAIVGRSGAGKSTLMDLLLRFRDPTSGTVLVDGKALTELDVASWRARLAIMAQDVHLFNDTVANNIGYGRAGVTDKEIREAARIAGADGFIADLPQGYDTPLGDEGVRLSGGQRQRIALARTILRDPDLLLLDEATNALDGESERFFQTALRDYARGRTVVVIAHRLSTVEGADRVIVLDAGRVVESGSPRDLLMAAGPYARLHGLQAVEAG